MTPGLHHAADATPTISVVVPVRNGRDDLAACLDAIAASMRQPDEILVVDDGSTDDTAEVARANGARVLRLDRNHGPAHARNRGAEAARGELIFFTDADVRVHPDTIGVALDVLRADPSLAAVMGSYDETPADPGFVSQYKNLFHHWVHQHSSTEASTFWTGCGAIRRDVFLAIGGFNEGYRKPSIEDIELGFRMRAAGCRIRLEKRMLASHAKRWRLGDLLHTDVFLRGAPWIALMLRDRHSPRDLNLSAASKLATVFAGLFLLSLVALPLLGHAAAVLPAVVLFAATAASARLAVRIHRRRLSGLIASVGVAAATAAAWIAVGDALCAVPLGLLAAIAASHPDLYAFFARRRGVAFALGVLPMHVLFQLSCAASVPLGALEHLSNRRRALQAAEGPAIQHLPPLAARDENRARRAGA